MGRENYLYFVRRLYTQSTTETYHMKKKICLRLPANDFLKNGLYIISLLLLMACRTGPGQVPEEGWGRVVSVIDGDTFDLLLDSKKSIRIRLNGIDAPERGMPYGKVSKQYLGKLCAGGRVRYVQKDIDRYGRMVAKCFLPDGSNIEASMVAAGMAWHYTRYSSDKKLQALEDEARANRRGLWQDPNPIAPWEYRKMKRGNG